MYRPGTSMLSSTCNAIEGVDTILSTPQISTTGVEGVDVKEALMPRR
jgi:hypothetical protein